METKDSKLSKQIQDIQALAKDNKNVDVAALMMGALESHTSNLVPQKSKRVAYLVSIGVPPFGLLFALKYFFSDYDDAQHTAYACVALTLASVGMVYFFSRFLLASSGVTPQQLQQIKPNDIQQLVQ